MKRLLLAAVLATITIAPASHGRTKTGNTELQGLSSAAIVEGAISSVQSDIAHFEIVGRMQTEAEKDKVANLRVVLRHLQKAGDILKKLDAPAPPLKSGKKKP